MGTCAGNMCWEESLEDSLYTWTLANKSNTTSDSFGKPHLKGKKWCQKNAPTVLGFLLLWGYPSSPIGANPFASGACVCWSSLQDGCDYLKNALLIVSNILLTSSPRFFRVSLYLFVLVPTLFFNLNRSVPLWCLSLRRAILSPLSLPFAKLNKSHPSTSSHQSGSPFLLSPYQPSL